MIQDETQEMRVAPLPSIKRLPLYLRTLKAMKSEGRESVSCTHIADGLRADPTQVRKDLAITGIVGRPKVGYDLNELIGSIESFLGWNNASDAFLVGAGSLGTALLGYTEFADLGIKIIGAFDSNPEKVGRKIRGCDVLPVEKLPGLARRMHVHIGIITVPPHSAQAAADLMLEGGILAIWSFANAQIKAPPHIIVERADWSSSLAALTSRLRQVIKP
jgi:redox-sensing transcriptional repressor